MGLGFQAYAAARITVGFIQLEHISRQQQSVQFKNVGSTSSDTYTFSSDVLFCPRHSSRNMQEEHVVDESRGPYFPFNRRETYPKRLKVDFRRLPVREVASGETLEYEADDDDGYDKRHLVGNVPKDCSAMIAIVLIAPVPRMYTTTERRCSERQAHWILHRGSLASCCCVLDRAERLASSSSNVRCRCSLFFCLLYAFGKLKFLLPLPLPLSALT